MLHSQLTTGLTLKKGRRRRETELPKQSGCEPQMLNQQKSTEADPPKHFPWSAIVKPLEGKGTYRSGEINREFKLKRKEHKSAYDVKLWVKLTDAFIKLCSSTIKLASICI